MSLLQGKVPLARYILILQEYSTGIGQRLAPSTVLPST